MILKPKIKSRLRNAATTYERGGYKGAADWALATSTYFDAAWHLIKADEELEIIKKREIMGVASRYLKSASELFGKAGYPNKEKEILERLERVKKEEEIHISALNSITKPAIFSSTIGISAPACPLETSQLPKFDDIQRLSQGLILFPEVRPIEEKARDTLDVRHDVFICYSSNDKGVADATCHFLEQQGIKCWIAPRDVSTGSYASSIVEAIENSKLMVLIFTNSANFSNHVKRELELAVSNGLTIQHFRTEAVEPTSELKYYLSSMHWLDALTPPLEDHLSKLAKMVSQLLEVI